MKPFTKDVLLYGFAIIIVLAILVIVGMLIFVKVPPENSAILNILIGVLASAFTGIVGYFFGSSKGSADKTALLAQAPPIPTPDKPTGTP